MQGLRGFKGFRGLEFRLAMGLGFWFWGCRGSEVWGCRVLGLGL